MDTNSCLLFLLFLLIPEFGTVPLLMSVTRRIRLFEDSDTTNETSLATSNTHHMIAVDYHLARGEVYYSDATGRIYRTRLNAAEELEDPPVIAEVKVSDGIAVDWLHDHLYWTDVERKTLEVATLDGLNRRILFNETHGLQKPRAVVVDPAKGLLFWSDWGDNAKVESSGLDGKNIKTVTSKNLYWPNGLTLDMSGSKIYILDGFLSTISSCNYDGSDFKQLSTSKENLLQAFGLTFYANTLYWDSWRSRTLFKLNTDNLKTESLLRQTGLVSLVERMMGLKAVHSSLQPPRPAGAADPCEAASCSHSCLLGRDLAPSCSCPFGYKLSNDGKTCHEEGYLLVSWRRTIRRYNMDGNEEEWMIDATKAAISISYHIQKSLVFWSDIEEHRIYRAPLDQLNNKTVVASPETCDGLAVDWVHDVLYWTDTDRNTLEAARLDGSDHMVIFNTGLDQPRDIALDPSAGLMFWTDWGALPKIERSTLDGLERKTIIDDNHIWPNGITLDIPMKKLYYVDGKLGTIYSSLYDGSERMLIFVPPPSTDLQLFAITTLNDELYWTDWQSRTLYRSPKDEITTAKSIATSSTILLRPNGVKAVHSSLQKQKENPCASIRCTNLCLGTKYQTAHCMGEESKNEDDIDVRLGESSPEKYHLSKTVSNDSMDISVNKPLSSPVVAISVKCLSRDGCKNDSRCSEKAKFYHFTDTQNETSFHITGLLPSTHYQVLFLSTNLEDSFTIITTPNNPPEIPRIISVEKLSKKVKVKWQPVDTCVPGFDSYNYGLVETGVVNGPGQGGSTNETEVVFENLKEEVNYTITVYTYDPNHFSSESFKLHRDAPPECHDPKFLCNGKEDCPDGSDEDLTHCAGIENVIVYKKSKSDLYFKVEVKKGTEKQLDKFVGSYGKAEQLNNTGQFERPAEPCVLWPESYCFHVTSLQSNTIYHVKISAVTKGGQVGEKFIASAITKEEASGPPENAKIIARNTTFLEYQWQYPKQSNGPLKNFLINIDEIDTHDKEKCCTPFPILEVPISQEELFYQAETTGLTPASSYAISIAARNTYFGTPATIVGNTPPPPMKMVRMPRVTVSSLLPLSWQPPSEEHEPEEGPVYHDLIRSYMLILLPPKNETLDDSGSNINDAVMDLLKSKLGDRFVVIWDKKVEEGAAFLDPIKVENLKARKQYKLAWVQVSQYKDSYSIDILVSDPFIAI